MADRKGFPLRLDPEIYEELQRWSSAEFRSMNGQIEYLLRCALQNAGRLPGSNRAHTSKDAGAKSKRAK